MVALVLSFGFFSLAEGDSTEKTKPAPTLEKHVSIVDGDYYYYSDHTVNFIKYSSPVHLDEFVSVYEDGEDIVINESGNIIRVSLEAEDSKGNKQKLKDVKDTDSKIVTKKTITKVDDTYHFYWEVEGMDSKKELSAYNLKVESQGVETEMISNPLYKGFKVGKFFLDVKDLEDTGFTLEEEKGSNSFKIKDGVKKINDAKVVLDPLYTYSASTDLEIDAVGTDDVIGLGTTVTFDDGSSSKGIIYFDYMGDLPTNTEVTKAEVWLYLSTSSSADVKTMYPIMKSWSHVEATDTSNDATTNGTTWLERWYGNNANDGCGGGATDEDWCAVGLQAGTDYNNTAGYYVQTTGGTGYRVWDMYAWVNATTHDSTRSSNNGFLIANSDSSDHAFRTKEYTGTSNDPYMNITYTMIEAYESPARKLPINGSYQSNRSIVARCNASFIGISPTAQLESQALEVYTSGLGQDDPNYPATSIDWYNFVEADTVWGANNQSFESTTTLNNDTLYVDGSYWIECWYDYYFPEIDVLQPFWVDTTYDGSYHQILQMVTIDTVKPTITFVEPSPSGNEQGSSQTVNVTISDATPVSACILEWAGANESMTVVGNNSCFKTKTGLTLGSTYSYKVYANDSANNLNVSATQSTTIVDSTPPTVSIAYPTAGLMLSSGTNINLNFTVTDDFIGSCKFTTDGGATNTSIPSCANTTFTRTNGAYTLVLYANDTSGNQGSASVSFSVDTDAPVLNVLYPSNGSSFTTAISTFNYSVSDLNLQACWYSTNGGTTNTSTSPPDTVDANDANPTYLYVIDDSYVSRTADPPNTLPPDTGSSEIVAGDYVNLQSDNGVYHDFAPQDVNGYAQFRTKIDASKTYGSLSWTWNGKQTDVASNQRLKFYAWNFTSSTWFYLSSSGCTDVTTYGSDVTRTCTLSSGTSNFIDASGYTYFLVWAYVTGASGSTQTVFDDYFSMTATPTGCYNITGLSPSQGWNTWNIWANDTLGRIGSNVTTFFVDSQPPAVSITAPATDDQWYYTQISVNYTASDIQLSSCWWNVNNGANNSIACGTNITGQTWTQGQNNVTVWANDTAGNKNSSTRRFYIDTIYPLIDWGAGVAGNGTSWAQSNIYMNVSYTEINLQKFDYYWATAPTACTSGSSFPTASSSFNKTGLADGTYNYCVKATDYGGLTNTTSQRTITIDGTSPVVTITSPASNGLYFNNVTLGITWTASDTYIQSCWRSANGGANTSITCNQTYSQTWNEGSNSITFYANDSVGHVTTSTRTFIIDTIAPQFGFGGGYGTFTSGGFIDRNWTNLNVTCTENLGNHTLWLWNATGSDGSAFSGDYTEPDSCAFLWGITNMNEGIELFNVTGYDKAGNYNYSITVNVTVDTISPTITINYPTSNGQWFTVNTTDINFTASDATLYNCWYSLDGGANTSKSCTENFTTETWSQGAHTITIWANDSVNHTASATRTWNVDSVAPTISILSPASDGLNFTTNNFAVNYLASDTNLASCWWNDNNGANTTLSGCANITGQTWAQGAHSVKVYANDSTGSTASATRTFNVDSINPALSIVSPASDNLWFTVNTTDILYTATDTNRASCWYSMNGGANTTLTDCANITTPTWSEGQTNITIWVNDTFGNKNSSTRKFYTDSVLPVVSISFPASNGLNYTTNNFQIAFSATDTNRAVCWYNTGGANTTTSCTANISGVTWAQGSNTINIFSNDSAGNVGSASRQFGVDTIAPSLTIASPSGNYTNRASKVIDLNVSSSDATAGLSIHWYSLNGGANTTFTPNSTLTAIAGQNNLTVYVNDTYGNLNSSSIQFYLKYSPNITASNFTDGSTPYYNESNATYPEYSNVTFTVDTSDEDSGTSGLYYRWIVDGVEKLAGIGQKVFSWLFSSQNSVVQVIVNDTDNLNVNKTFNMTFLWVSPQIAITNPTPSIYQNSPTTLNYTLTEANPNTCWYSTGGANITITCGNNVSGLSASEGSNTWTVWVNDSVGQSNYSSVTFTLDTINPVINIIYPEEKNYNTNVSLPINFTATDTNLDDCWYNLDNGANTTVACTFNTTFNTSEGSHTMTVFANDTSGRQSSHTHSFTVNLAPPSTTINFPDDNVWLNYRTNIQINYTPSDTDGISKCDLYSNFNGTWGLNESDNTVTSDAINTFTKSLNDGTYIWNIWCEDTSSNGAWATITNRTLRIDGTTPLIDWDSALASGTESTQTFIYASITLTETNLKNVTYNLYKSDHTIYNSSVYTSAVLSINWTGLPDDIYFYNVTAWDNASNKNSTTSRNITLDDTAPDITINSPESINYANNNSILINTTITDNLVGLDTCLFSVYRDGTSNYYYSNVSFNCVNYTIGLPAGDYDYVIEFSANDTLGNEEETATVFGIRTIAPSVVLVNPTNNLYLDNGTNINFRFRPTDSDGIGTCKAYGNFNGTWLLNATTTSAVSGSIFNIFNLTLAEQNNYSWNVWCNDTYGNNDWALLNASFHVDLTNPSLNITAPTNASSQSLTFTMRFNSSDLNINTCSYNVRDVSSGDWEYSPNQSLTCSENGTKSITLSADTYDVYVWAVDKAGRTTEKILRVTTTNPSNPSTGGGGDTAPTKTIIKELASNYSIEAGLSNKLDFVLARNSVAPRTKLFTITNKGLEPITVKLSCDTTMLNASEKTTEGGLINICKYVQFADDVVEVSPNEAVGVETYIYITTPVNASFGDAYNFNILATRVINQSETQEVIQYSKLAVTSRVPLWGMIFKWSYVPLQDDTVSADDKNSYPVAPVAVLISFIVFTVTFLIFRKKLALTGFSLGVLLFFITFGLLLFLL